MNAVITSSVSSTLTVGQVVKVQFGNKSDSAGYHIGEAEIMAIREDGMLLVREADLFGPAAPVADMLYNQSYPEGVVASCTHACQKGNMEHYYGSQKGFFEAVGFKDFEPDAIVVGEKITIQFGNPGDSSGYRVAPATVLAVRKDKALLVKEGNFFGVAIPLWSGNKDDYPFTVEAACTMGCSEPKIDQFFGSKENFFESMGFKGFAA